MFSAQNAMLAEVLVLDTIYDYENSEMTIGKTN